MTIAIPEWRGRVSPVFDVAERIWVFRDDSDPEHAGGPEIVSLGTAARHDRTRRLVELGVRVLVCGAISAELEELLTDNKIRVVPLVCGEIDQVVQAYRAKTLTDDEFSMPGCHVRMRQRRRHRWDNSGPERGDHETGSDDSAT